MQIGYIGLGKMGKNMVLHLLEQEIEIVAWNRSPGPLEDVVKAGATAADSLNDLVKKLKSPRIIWVMLTAGEVTDEYINKLAELIDKGDLIIDGGNSFYKDTLKHGEKLNKLGINFMDIGTSGGPGGARTGACLMIGGSREDFQKIEPLAKAAGAPNAYQHLGPIGAGHFAKMVHNGIEYGMMEALAEGIEILHQSPFKYDFVKLLDLYNHRSVVESRLVGWLQDAFKKDLQLASYSSKIGRTGEGDWTVATAKELKVDARVLEDAVKVRVESEKSPESLRNKAISAMRSEFGKHGDAKTIT